MLTPRKANQLAALAALVVAAAQDDPPGGVGCPGIDDHDPPPPDGHRCPQCPGCDAAWHVCPACGRAVFH
jgi:hypothetical protein